MKTLYQLLLTTGLLASQFSSDALAQCHTYPAYFNSSAPVGIPATGRFYNFQIDGRGFSFDLQTREIFCGGVKIGVQTPGGQIELLPDAAARINGGAPAQPGVVGGAPVTGGAVGGPAVGGPVNGGPVNGAPVNGGAVGAPVNGAPVNGAPVNGAPATGSPAINARPATGGQQAPVANPVTAGSVAPAAAVNSPLAANAPIGGAIPSLGNGISQTEKLFFGQWRAENKNILGRNVVRELTFVDDKNLTLLVQAGGEETQTIEGEFEFKDGKLSLKGDDRRELGLVSTDNGQLILKGDETLTFKRVE